MTITCPTTQIGVLAQSYWPASAGNTSSSTATGLIDHNTFYNASIYAEGYPANGAFLYLNDGSTNWSTTLGLGTATAVYAEDNIFTFTTDSAAMICQYSGRLVARYNVVHDSFVYTRGADNDARGCRLLEIYSNTLTNSANCCGTYRPMQLWGGTGAIYNNIVSGATYGSPHILLDVLRANTSGGTVFGLCNGSGLWDGNLDSSGGPCLDQIGRASDNIAFDATPPPYPVQTTDPLYIWNNTINGVPLPAAVPDVQSKLRILEGRDYIVNRSRPSYTAYTYPHPLQGASPDASPTPSILSCVVIAAEKMVTFVWTPTGMQLYGMVCP